MANTTNVTGLDQPLAYGVGGAVYLVFFLVGLCGFRVNWLHRVADKKAIAFRAYALAAVFPSYF